MIPTIETDRLLLLPPDSSCFDLYEEFYTDAEASAAYGGPTSSARARARLKEDICSWSVCGFGVWVIQDKASKSLLGCCGFWQGEGWPRELTWWLLPQMRGKGYAREASLAAVSYAYDDFGWEKVETYMEDSNQAAKVLVQRLGGECTRRDDFPDGLSRDVYLIPQPR